MPELTKTIVTDSGTDMAIGLDEEGNLGLFGGCNELLMYLDADDAGFFRKAATYLSDLREAQLKAK